MLTFFSLSAFSFSYAPKHGAETDSYEVYGLVVLPYCGGYIETYLRRQWWQYVLTVKLSPPKGQNWVLNNSNVLLVDMALKDKPLTFRDFYEINTKDSKGSDIAFHIKDNIKSKIDKFGVSFSNIKGCSANEKQGTTLSLSPKF